MGKQAGFESRFCLLEDGVKLTKKAAIWGFPFGLPGAAVSVGLDPDSDRDKMGIIKVAGPVSNLIFGFILLVLSILTEPVGIQSLILQGASLNFVLGLFNMIPKSVKNLALDGEFIIKWNKGAYFVVLGILIIGMIAVNVMSSQITQ